MAARASPSVARSGIELSLNAYIDMLMVRHGEGVAGRQHVLDRLQQLGYSVGRRLTERLMLGRAEVMDGDETVVKFVCVTLWPALHGRKASRLSRAKAKDSYTIEDASFRFFQTLAAPAGVDARDTAGRYCMFTKGAVKGALVALGVDAAVHVDWTTAFPAARFRLKLGSPLHPEAV